LAQSFVFSHVVFSAMTTSFLTIHYLTTLRIEKNSHARKRKNLSKGDKR